MSTGTSGGHELFAAALVQPDVALPRGLRAWNGSDPAQRFNVYRNNVMVSLTGALATAFPVVRQLVGETFFAGMAQAFARHTPPRSPVMSLYGNDFPGFIAGFAPAASVPYLADVARLEAARVAAYHAADAPALSAADFAALPGDQLAELRVDLHPAVAVLVSPHAIVSLWGAHNGGPDLAEVDPSAGEAALVSRPGDDVIVLALAPGVPEALASLAAGETFAAAIDAGALAAATFEPAALFHALVTTGAVTAVHLPEPA